MCETQQGGLGTACDKLTDTCIHTQCISTTWSGWVCNLQERGFFLSCEVILEDIPQPVDHLMIVMIATKVLSVFPE